MVCDLVFHIDIVIAEVRFGVFPAARFETNDSAHQDAIVIGNRPSDRLEVNDDLFANKDGLGGGASYNEVAVLGALTIPKFRDDTRTRNG